jgi:terminase small subunit-like protein
MRSLNNPKHERFAQELAKGKSASQAYVDAGYSKNDGNAIRLKGNERVQARVKELQERVAEKVVAKTALSKEWVLEKLPENLERALQQRRARNDDGEEVGDFTYQGNVANRALELIGKEIGMFIDRKEVGKPGDFAGMTDDELDAFIASGENPSGGGDRGAERPPVQARVRQPH